MAVFRVPGPSVVLTIGGEITGDNRDDWNQLKLWKTDIPKFTQVT